jgi:hypothetical protein
LCWSGFTETRKGSDDDGLGVVWGEGLWRSREEHGRGRKSDGLGTEPTPISCFVQQPVSYGLLYIPLSDLLCVCVLAGCFSPGWLVHDIRRWQGPDWV